VFCPLINKRKGVAVLLFSAKIKRLRKLFKDAYHDKQQALNKEYFAWERMEITKSRNNPKINQLNQKSHLNQREIKKRRRLTKQILDAISHHEYTLKMYNKLTDECARQKQQFDQEIIRLTNVPMEHRNNVLVEIEPNNHINILFGGIEYPAGYGHGHYVIDETNTISYHRKPGEPHGPQNYWPKITNHTFLIANILFAQPKA
jgi:hypothetical protein